MATPKMLPIIVSDRLDATHDFYVDTLGWAPVDKMEGYLQVRAGSDEAAPELAFMAAQPPEGPLGARIPLRTGLVVSIAVADADAHRERLRERGADPAPVADRPWGWRSFLLDDPNGVTLDFFHPIAQDPAQDASS